MNENKLTPTKSSPLPVRRRAPTEPTLRFSPTAWAKLIYLRDLGWTEVGGFAISAADDLLCVDDVQMVRQDCSPVTVRFDDHSVADFFDRQIDAGLKPEQFSRIWVHTHPGNCPLPSSTDEETFERVFGQMEWAVMFILAKGGQTYARLRFNAGPGGEIKIPVSVDFTGSFAASDQESWKREYDANLIDIELLLREQLAKPNESIPAGPNTLGDRQDFADPFFDPDRNGTTDEYELHLQGYYYDY
jgi:proteasome lid subunit RPN8/RPN11